MKKNEPETLFRPVGTFEMAFKNFRKNLTKFYDEAFLPPAPIFPSDEGRVVAEFTAGVALEAEWHRL